MATAQSSPRQYLKVYLYHISREKLMYRKSLKAIFVSKINSLSLDIPVAHTFGLNSKKQRFLFCSYTPLNAIDTIEKGARLNPICP